MSICEKCANMNCNHAVEPNEIVVQCGAYKPPMTNADRIRAMSDEELADFLTEFSIEAFAAGAIKFSNVIMDAQKRLEWLQQPAEEGTP